METYKINTALLIRLLEMAREDLKDDLQIHFIVEQMASMKQDLFTMKDYARITSILNNRP